MTEKKETAGLRPTVTEAGENAQPHNPSNPLLAQALRYAEHGWAVFPLQPKGKTPLTSHGCKDPSKDIGQIKEWWKSHPDANIGIATGEVSGFFVVDVDGQDGESSLKKLEERHAPLPSTVEVITGGDGRHLYFKMPDGHSIRNSAGKIADKVDIRGDGGYVVAPPSVHASGRTYIKSVDSAGAIVPAPPWLLALIQENPQAKQSRAFSEWEQLLGGTEEGQRNDSLSRLAGLLFGSNLHPHIATELCLCWNEARCKPPLTQDEALRTINSIAGREFQKKEQFHG